MKKLSSISEFHNFETTPLLVGKLIGPILRDQDSLDGTQKKGSVMGFEIEDEDGKTHLAGASHMINKSLTNEECGIGSIVGIKFMGKTVNAKKQPLNKHEVILFDDFNEANEYYASESNKNVETVFDNPVKKAKAAKKR